MLIITSNTYNLFVSIGALIFLLLFAALNSSNNYSLNKIGFAISQKHHHNSKSFNTFNADKPTLSSHKTTKTKTKTSSSSHHPNLSPTSLVKLVILTFGDTIRSQFTTAKPILDQYGFKASFL